jgi:hypothetical protein
MYRYVTLHQNVNTCSYCNVCITHIFCKASPIPLKYDNICFIKNCFQNCCMEIHVKIGICTFYLYKIHLGLNNKKCILIISVFMKKISQNKKKFTQDTLFSEQYQRISEQLI